MEWFRERSKGEEAALVMTRDLGGRGLDFPAAESVLFVSPRSNYQTVAQEIARIGRALEQSRSHGVNDLLSTPSQRSRRRPNA
jgi:superfamily II DNA or RNA helicase